MQNQARETGTRHSDQLRHAAPMRRTASGAIDIGHYTRLARAQRAGHMRGILQDGLRYLADKLSPLLRAISRSGIDSTPRKLRDRSWSSCHD